MTMAKRFICLLLAALLLPLAALAGGQYIIPDSNTRHLTKEELWQWNYESLGFILNEIFARHGYNFEPGKKYDNFFRDRPWYTPNENPDNRSACYSQLSRLEWNNEHLVKVVLQEMRAQKTRNTRGKSYLDVIEQSFDVLSGFRLTTMKPNQKFTVYSAPDVSSYIGAGGKAKVSTNGAVYAAGWDQGFLLVMYLTNNGSVRVGYIDGNKIKDSLTLPKLALAYQPVTLLTKASLTDDPAMGFSQIMTLPKGAQVTYLSEFQNRYAWAYIETQVNGQTVRGFLSADALDLMGVELENEDAAADG